jgi:hypothetical protein
MSTISFGSKQDGQHSLRIFHPFLAQIMRQQMQHTIQMEQSKTNRVI